MLVWHLLVLLIVVGLFLLLLSDLSKTHFEFNWEFTEILLVGAIITICISASIAFVWSITYMFKWEFMFNKII